MGSLGEELSRKYNVKSIPSLVLVDVKTGKVINKDGVNELRKDLSGVGFPWRGAAENFIRGVVPGPVRKLLGGTVGKVVGRVWRIFKGAIGLK